MNTESIDKLVDAFVTLVNTGARPLKLADEISAAVASPTREDPELWEWSIRPFVVDWLAELERRLPMPFPAAFRSLASRYIYPEFSYRAVTFFANTPDTIGYAAHELRVAMFRDRKMFAVLSKHGLLQFGQPSDGSYDAICFDMRGVAGRLKGGVVRLDHEEILMHDRISCVDAIAPSFLALIDPTAG